MMKDRIATPLHNAQGRLIGYAGRLVDDEAICDNTPKYLFPGSRERDGKQYEFHKSLVVYNLYRLASRWKISTWSKASPASDGCTSMAARRGGIDG
jgi:hypothetical protein